MLAVGLREWVSLRTTCKNKPILFMKNIIYIFKCNVEVNYFGDVLLVILSLLMFAIIN